MKNAKISNAVIKRLPRYRRYLIELRKKGVEVIQVDREPFRKVGEDMIKDYCERYPEFWEMVSLLREKGAR